MIRFVVSELSAQTPKAEQDKLVAAVSGVKGVKDVALAGQRRELPSSPVRRAPKLHLLKAACASVGFTLGQKM